jgi:NAD(P)-dependent dehydrogenase (short-subunit alcohol dehydrogenase family)
LAGKVAIVTGAGMRGDVAGVGQAIATLFAREGARVLLVDLDMQNAEKTLAAIQAEGGEAGVFRADVSQNADCQALVEAAVARYGSLQILVNNVGVHAPGSALTVDEAVWDRTFEINLKSMMLTSKYAIPKMIETGGGSIINLSSVDGLRAGAWFNLPYAVSKGGVITLTSHMAVHHGRDHIRVNCIAPGMLYTAMVKDRLTPELREQRRQVAPLALEGNAWDIASAALFLASDEARWITGVTLPVDGGLLAATPSMLIPRTN